MQFNIQKDIIWQKLWIDFTLNLLTMDEGNTERSQKIIFLLKKHIDYELKVGPGYFLKNDKEALVYYKLIKNRTIELIENIEKCS